MTKRVMIVDDSKATRSMVAFTLQRAGYEVLQAENGVLALAVIEKNQIDCLITDVNMPDMNGYELIRRLRDTAAHRTTPILLLTTTIDSGGKETAQGAGATACLGKPFLPAELIEVVSGML